MSKKTMMIAVLVLGMTLLFIGGGFFVMWSKLGSLETLVKDGLPAPAPVAPAHGAASHLLKLDPFIVNLADEKANRYLRFAIDIQLSSADVQTEVSRRLSEIRSAILLILPTKKVQEIQSVAGKVALKTEIIDSLNALLQSGKVNNLYFTEFVVQ